MRKALTAIAASIALFALPLLTTSRVARAQQDPPRQDCCFHIFSAGSNLGWASSLLNYTYNRIRLEQSDETTFANILRAGQHVEMAYKTCSAINPAWTDWGNRKQYLANQVDAIRRQPDTVVRKQVAASLMSTSQWGQVLRVRVLGNQKYEHDTCAEKYFKLGFQLGYAQQTLLIAGEIQRSGRNDWAGVVSDARTALQSSTQVLNEYFSLEGCTDIRDLDLPGRIMNLMQADPSQLQLINNAMLLTWQSLHDRLVQRCELAIGQPPQPPTPAGTGLVGVWRCKDPEAPTIRFDFVNGEYHGVVVELGYLARMGYQVGELVYIFRQNPNNPQYYTGKEKGHNNNGTFFWVDLTIRQEQLNQFGFQGSRLHQLWGSRYNTYWYRASTP